MTNVSHNNEVPDKFKAQVANLSPTKRALLELRRKKQKKRNTLKKQGVLPNTPLPLSFSQQRLWFLNQLDPNSPAYNISKAIQIEGPLQVPVLKRALEAIIARHATLRTTFTIDDDNPQQIITDNWSFELPLLDLSHLSEAEQTAVRQRTLREQVNQPFDLTADLLLRATLLQCNSETYILLLVTHHIASDAWSTDILFQELGAFYGAFLAKKPPFLPELSIQYADFAVWQRSPLQESSFDTHLTYWKQQLADAPSVIELPTDHPRSTIRTSFGQQTTFQIPQTLHDELKALSQKAGATLFMTLLAAFKVLLYRYTGQENVVVGTPIANRNHVEVERLIGFFANTLVLHTEFAGKPTFQQALTRVREVALNAYTHQDMPFEMLVEALQPTRNLDINPLFQVMFIFRDRSNRTLSLPGLTVSNLPKEIGTEQFDLTLAINTTSTYLDGTLTYNADLFEKTTIERIIGHFHCLLESIVANPEMPISQLPFLTQAERRQLLVAWNDTAVLRHPNPGIHHLFEAQAAQTPNAKAVMAGQTSLTYGELNAKANQLAHYLQKHGVGPEVLVGICMERSLEMVVGLLGILKAGGAYVPFDPEHPQERLAFMAEDAQISLLLSQSILLENLSQSSAKIIALDTDWPLVAQEAQTNAISNVRGDNVAYVMYTSGSTGQPKGVVILHQGVCNYLLWRKQYFPLNAADRILQKTSFSFVDSVWELFEPLMVGAQLIMAAPNMHQDPRYLVQFIREQQITAVDFIPSLLHLFLEEPEVEHCTSLRRVTTGSETVLVELQDRFFTRLKADLYNLYGPTEASIASTCWTCQRGGSMRSVPIGKPIANTQIYLLDAQGQPVPIGLPGEVHIGGIGLARGYLNRPALTAEKFISNPFSGNPKTRLYKTGDLARYLPDGNLEFLGRIDHQVKLRGYRIELGEIEAFLHQHPTVQKAVALVREDDPGDKRLVAYVLPASQQTIDTGTLRTYLKEKLPDYMVPSAVVVLDTLPLTPNGKVNRQALPKPDQTRPELEDAFVGPQTPVEKAVAAIWAEVLKIERVGIHDNFFELGGHSLLATKVVSRIRNTFKMNMLLRTLFEVPTVAGLSLIVTQNQVGAHNQQVVEQTLTELEQLSDAEVSHLLSMAPYKDEVDPKDQH